MKWAFGPPIYPVKIPLPPLATQQAIVAEIEAEQALVAANRELMARFEQKIQATLARVWGEDSDSANGAPPSQPGATPQKAYETGSHRATRPVPGLYPSKYSMVNGCAPAEADMQRFFQITPPSVHSMVLTLERRGFIQRVPGQARSIMIVPPESLPPLKRAQP